MRRRVIREGGWSGRDLIMKGKFNVMRRRLEMGLEQFGFAGKKKDMLSRSADPGSGV